MFRSCQGWSRTILGDSCLHWTFQPARQHSPSANLTNRSVVPCRPRTVPQVHTSPSCVIATMAPAPASEATTFGGRSEEHTSELQSLTNLVCRLLLEKKKKK